eukprot:gene23877-biopygen17868
MLGGREGGGCGRPPSRPTPSPRTPLPHPLNPKGRTAPHQRWRMMWGSELESVIDRGKGCRGLRPAEPPPLPTSSKFISGMALGHPRLASTAGARGKRLCARGMSRMVSFEKRPCSCEAAFVPDTARAGMLYAKQE